MLTADGCRKRRERLWASLPEKPDWILLYEPQHLTYYANYYASPFVFRTQNAAAVLILGADGSSLLIADNILQPYVEASHVDKFELPIWYRSKESAPERQKFLIKAALNAMKLRRGDKIGVEGAVPSGLVQALRDERKRLKIVDVSPAIHLLKRRKDPDELVLMRKSIAAMEAGFAAAIAGFKPGMTELQAYELVQKAVMEAAGEQVTLYGDFVSGPRTELTGGPPSSRVMEKNDLFLLDFSVILHGYRGDFANTFVIDGGTPTDRQKELAGYCYEAMDAAEKLLKPGANCKTVDMAARNVFEMRHLGESFPHHTGHGLGLGHPDPPYIVPASSDTLVSGDIVTIEPGQYIKGVGGMRFERNYLITDTGYETLSKHQIALEPQSR